VRPDRTSARSLGGHRQERHHRVPGAPAARPLAGLGDDAGHVEIRDVREGQREHLSRDDLHHLGDIMTRVRDHMRAQPPRSAAPRKRRLASPAPDATQDSAGVPGGRLPSD
jgi:hypothetical protein